MAVRWFNEGRIRIIVVESETEKIKSLLCGKSRSTYKISDKLYVQYIGVPDGEVQLLIEERNDRKIRISVLSNKNEAAELVDRSFLTKMCQAVLAGDLHKCKEIELETLKSLSGL